MARMVCRGRPRKNPRSELPAQRHAREPPRLVRISHHGVSQEGTLPLAVGMDADGEDRADAEEGGKQVRASVAEERQGHALRRQGLADDADVEHGLEEDDEGEADHEEASEPVGRLAGDVDGEREEGDEEEDDADGEDDAELLRADREDEVRMRLGQVEVLLHGLAEPRAPDVAVADRGEGLVRLVGRALGRGVGDLRARAVEIEAETVLLAKSIDGVYDDDPKVNKNAKKFDEISLKEVVSRGLKVVDTTASALALENGMPFMVFDLNEENSIVKALSGEFSGTRVTV